MSGLDVSSEAARLHLEFFRRLHPKTFGVGFEGTKALMKGMVERNPELYSGAFAKPLILKLLEGFDAANGFGIRGKGA